MIMRTFIGAMVVLGAVNLATVGVASAEPPQKLWSERTGGGGLDPDGPISMRAFSKLAKELTPAVVNISVERRAVGLPIPFMPNGGGSGLGSGFIIHKDGYVLTNNHVIEGANDITVKLANEHEYAARVVGTYPPLDVALLKMDAKEALVVAPLGNSERLDIGEWVIAIGNPFGLSHTVTAGIVSAKGRRDVTPGNEPNLARFIQTDASINPGNSGGPLINVRGEVIGINTAINAAGQGIGFAVPIDMVKTVLGQLAQGKVSRSYLGVLVGPVSKELAKAIGADRPTGALITEVKAGTPAAEAGIEPGDVVMSFDGKPVDHWEDLPWLASTTGADRSVTVMVNRQGKTRELSVKLAAFPEDGATASAPGKGGKAQDVGIEVGPVPAARAKELGIEGGQGVVVKAIAKGSLAAEMGIEVGDVILQVNYQTITAGAGGTGGKEAFDKAVAATPRGSPLALTLRRGDRFMFKVFTR